jgi:RNA polymerase sigma-54 factor
MLKQSVSQKPNIKINQKINSNIINAIKILQMSFNEIEGFTKKEIEKNPFLLSSKPFYQANEIINNQSKNKNVKEWLYQQSSLIASSKEKESLVKVYIENLDNFGFCKITSTEAAQLSNTSDELSHTILLELKLLDPIGIFSHSISEHLSIQLKQKRLLDSKYEILLKNLQHLASGNFNKLAELCEVGKDQITNMVKNIRTLKPRPLEELEIEKIERVFPDIIVTFENSKININLYNDNQHQVIINEKYVNQMKIKQKELSNKEIKVYIQECIAHGKKLQNNLNRRNETLLLVAKNILNFQKKFFLKGEESILPLTHKYISEKIFMNESTISRAVKNKYLKYNNKTLPLSYFFSSKIKNKLNIRSSSSVSIKVKIKQLIDTEKQSDIIFSDQKIVNILKENDIIIARRTVTKYRESLQIPSSLIRAKNL